jgi:hypothetical protein
VGNPTKEDNSEADRNQRLHPHRQMREQGVQIGFGVGHDMDDSCGHRRTVAPTFRPTEVHLPAVPKQASHDQLLTQDHVRYQHEIAEFSMQDAVSIDVIHSELRLLGGTAA